MVLSAAELNETVRHLRKIGDGDRSRLQRIERHLHDDLTGKEAGIYVPRRASHEFKLIVDQARFNVLPLVVTAVAQNLFVDGYRPASPSGRVAAENAPIWDDVWQPNRMDARQAGLYRGAIAYGVSYAIVLPGDPVPVITPRSPLQLTAVFEDPLNDEWPELALETRRVRTVDGQKVSQVRVFDDTAVYTIDVRDGDVPIEILDVGEHGLGVTPIVPFFDQYELGGHSVGKVEPLIPVQHQLNQTTFSLLMAQQYGAFRQRWVTGMEIQEDENGNPREPFNASVKTLFHGESPDTRFGEFEQTDLSGYLNSRDKTLLHVASVAQIPPHNLIVGAGISNISAEALAALEAGHRMDIAEHQVSFGESIEQTLRLAGLAMGTPEGLAAWEDTSAQVVWRDTTPRSLSQVADALGKMAEMLAIPKRALWERIPNVTDQDIQRWTELAEESRLTDELDRMLAEESQEPQSAVTTSNGADTPTSP